MNQLPHPTRSTVRSLATPLLALALGVALTLVLRGYQFGGGNHSVYLIAPLRQAFPGTLDNDWWVTRTLQYHVVYTTISAWLMRIGAIEPVFLALYLGLAILLHIAWLKITRALGWGVREYLFSVLLYYLSAGGTGLGMYYYLQDSSFLPGNVANVAMLWGIAWWIAGRRWPAVIAWGIAGLFHLNHALVAIGFWGIMSAMSCWNGLKRRSQHETGTFPPTRNLLTLAVVILFCLPNIIPAARAALAGSEKMPLNEFVDLYVKLRHPHHYDPLSWPIALWVSFLWPLPMAWCAMTSRVQSQRSSDRPLLAATEGSAYGGPARTPQRANDTDRNDSGDVTSHDLKISRRRTTQITLYFLALQSIALLFAGVLFIAEPLIQMSLFRFSIYPKLLTCIGASAWLLQPGRLATPLRRALLLGLPAAALVAILALRLIRPATATGDFIVANFLPMLLFLGLCIAVVAGVVLIRSDREPMAANTPDSPTRSRWALAATCLLVAGVLWAAWHRWLGLALPVADRREAAYIEICHWARQNTPADAVFLVPPNEQLFRYHARRAIVVNFKGVPQLSGEMIQWKQRLQDVLSVDLANLPRRFDLAHTEMERRYHDLPPGHLERIARKYGARYILATRALPGRQSVFENTSGHLYDLQRLGSPPPADVK